MSLKPEVRCFNCGYKYKSFKFATALKYQPCILCALMGKSYFSKY